MPSDPTGRALRDMLHHIDLAEKFVEGLDRDTFKADLRAFYAVTRCLEIISEASRRLPNELRRATPRFPGGKWQTPKTFIVTTMRTLRLNWCGRPCSSPCRR